MGLYHSEIGIPEEIAKQLPEGAIELHYSKHAQEARRSDKYGTVPMIRQLNTKYAKVIEAESNGAELNKVVYRIKYNQSYDICIVVLVKIGLVKTVWMNRANDNHNSLDAKKYSK